jgi:hypothetical protein
MTEGAMFGVYVAAVLLAIPMAVVMAIVGAAIGALAETRVNQAAHLGNKPN